MHSAGAREPRGGRCGVVQGVDSVFLSTQCRRGYRSSMNNLDIGTSLIAVEVACILLT